MSEVINIHEVKTHLSRLLDKAHAGEEIVLGKAGKPYARLVPLTPVRRFIKGKVDPAFFDSLPKEELAVWKGR